MKISHTIALLFGFISVVLAQTEVTQIQFSKNLPFDNDDLREILQSEEDEEYEPRLIKLDEILLSNFFRKHGYLLVEVSDSLFFTKNRDKIRIKYNIDPGPKYLYSGVRFEGVKEIPIEKLAEQFEEIEIGTPFDESLIITAAKNVEDIYYNSGKPFAAIKTDFQFENDSLVIAVLQIQEGATVYIKKVNYSGLYLVQKFLIRRELEIQKGDLYNRKALEKSQTNIYGTGLFRFVRLEIDPIPGEPQNVSLNIIMQERDPRWIGVNFGVGHEQYYGSTAEVTLQGGHRNIMGTARSASLHFTPSFIYEFERNKIFNAENKIAFKFIEPWIGNTRTPGVFQISYHQYRLPNSADFNLLQTSFEVHHKFENDIEINGTISAKFLKRIDEEKANSTDLLEFDAGQSEIYSISSYSKRDTRPNLFNPEQGSLTDFSVAYSHSIGKDSVKTETNKFITVQASWSRYQPWKPKIGRKHFKWILAGRVKAGSIFEIGRTKAIPISELFYAGGATTVRGYQQQLLGPAASYDKNGKIETAAGGKFIFLSNVEARIPIFWLFVGEVFVDAGNVWSELSDFKFEDIRVSTGIGLAVITPLGPVRVDYGYKLTPTSIDPSPDAFHLGIYFAF